MSRIIGADWAVIRAQFEAGEHSGRAIAAEHGFSYTALQDRAKAENWRVPKAQVTKGDIPAHPPSDLDRSLPASDPPVTDANPTPNPDKPMTSVARTPDDIVASGHAMILRLLSELDASTAHIGELHKLIEDFNHAERDNRRRNAMLGAVNLSSRSTIIKNLAAAAKSLEEVKVMRGAKEIKAAQKAAQGVFAAPPAPRLVSNGR